MAGQPPSALNERSARIVFLALLAGTSGIVLVLGTLRGVIAPNTGESLVPMVRAVAFAVLVGNVLVTQVLRRRIPPCEPSVDRDAWWSAHGANARVLWAMADGSAALGAVLWFIAGDPVAFAGLAGFGVIALVANRPGRLVEG
jgi:hypothetical protein